MAKKESPSTPKHAETRNEKTCKATISPLYVHSQIETTLEPEMRIEKSLDSKTRIERPSKPGIWSLMTESESQTLNEYNSKSRVENNTLYDGKANEYEKIQCQCRPTHDIIGNTFLRMYNNDNDGSPTKSKNKG
mgnify:FL=1